MTTTLLRAGALSCALLTTTCLTAPAYAQSADLPPPTRYQVDENGVDLTRAIHIVNVTDIAIGPAGRGGLAYVRQFERWASRNPYDMGIFQASGSAWTATFGLNSYAFSLSGTTYTATDGSGATLTKSGATYTLTLPDGTVVTYANATLVTGDSARKARATNVAYPTGEQIGLSWVSATYCSNNSDGCAGGTWRTAVRLQGVTSSLGYQLHLNYGLAEATALAEYNVWKRLDSISAINTTVDSCSPSAHSCTLTQSWPTVAYSGNSVTDPAGRTSTYTTTGTTFAIRRPSSGSDNVVYTYNGSGYISSVVRDGLTWGYNYSLSGNVATMVVTDPGSHARTVVSDLAVGLPTSVTDELGHATTYTYDSAGRLTRITAPEGNYVAYSYDGRGNVTQVLSRDKGNTSANDIVTQADYPSSCSNVLTCNLPTATRDARGNQTDYTYDSTHGGLLTVTAPAPTTGAARPQTRYTYSSLTAPGGGSVYRPTAVSQCQTTSSCAGTADEAKTTIAYSQANLQPSSVSSGSGDGALTATIGIGYDSVARPITVDGPLSGSADTVRTRYNAAGQVIGTISPDPDGGGSLKHRAQRISYNGDGQVSKVETGTVDSQSDGDWAAFAPLEEVRQDYDTSARPTVQRLVSGSTTYALTQTSYDGEGRVQCVAQRMNPSEFDSLPSDACTLDTQGSDGPDRITRATYDNANRVTKVETGYGVTGTVADEVTRTFTDNGRVMTLTDANGNTTTYSHDGQDRMVQVLFPTTSATLDYETYYYDANGNLTSVRQRDGNSIGMTYDALNRLIARDLPGAQPDVTFTYDLMNRVTEASQADGHVLTYAYDALGRTLTQTNYIGTASSQYDLAGRRTRLTYPGSGLYVDYDHLVTGEISAIRENGATSGAGVLATYAYDDRGRRTSLTRGNGTVTSYSHDTVSRPTQIVQNVAGTTQDLTLDLTPNPAGQIASTVRSNDSYAWTGHYAVNRGYTANALNQYSAITGITPTYDSRGNLTSAGSTTYGYNADNMLISATTGSVQLGYDPLGRLAWTTGNPNLTRFAYDGQTVIAEYDGGVGLVRRFVHGPGTDEPLVQYDGTGTSNRSWFHADERGSIVAISNGSGAVTAVNSYDEYGIPGSGNSGRFQYTGQMWLGELGMYHYRARMYSPTLGRFLQSDPIGYGGGINLYGYVGNDPVNRTDALGLTPEDDILPPDCVGECVTLTGGILGGQTRPLVSGPFPDLFHDAYGTYGYNSNGSQVYVQRNFGWLPSMSAMIQNSGRDMNTMAGGQEQRDEAHEARPRYCYSDLYQLGQVFDDIGLFSQRLILAGSVLGALADGAPVTAGAPLYLHAGEMRSFGVVLEYAAGRPLSGYGLAQEIVPRFLGLDVLGRTLLDIGVGSVGGLTQPEDPCR